MIPDSLRIKKDIRVIGIHGKAGAGKDTIAAYIEQKVGDCYIHPFAYFLKDAAACAFGIPRGAFDDRECKEEVNEFWGVSPRQIAQFFGTELFREKISELLPITGDFWARRLVGFINEEIEAVGVFEAGNWGQYIDGDTLIIPDVRFENEAEWVREHGILIHVIREERDLREVGISGHKSEAGVTQGESDYVVYNNSTIEDLYARVDQVLIANNFIVPSNFNI